LFAKVGWISKKLITDIKKVKPVAYALYKPLSDAKKLRDEIKGSIPKLKTEYRIAEKKFNTTNRFRKLNVFKKSGIDNTKRNKLVSDISTAANNFFKSQDPDSLKKLNDSLRVAEDIISKKSGEKPLGKFIANMRQAIQPVSVRINNIIKSKKTRTAAPPRPPIPKRSY